MSLKAKLEAVIYAAEEPVTLAQLATLFAEEALEWKAEQEAAAAAQAAVAGEPEALPLLGEEPAEPETIAAAAEQPEPAAAATAEEGAEAPQAAEPAAEDPAAAEAEAKRLAKQRDRDVKAVLRRLLDELVETYAAEERGVEIREIAGGFRMATKPEFHDAVRAFVKSLKPALKLSLPALETLAVVAYKQPITAPEVNEIRGVDSSGVFGSLLARKLIATAGRKQVIGRPILYKTTKEFLLRFGLKDVAELPSMEEFEKMAAAELEETTITNGSESIEDGTGPEWDENAGEGPETAPAEPAAEEPPATEAAPNETDETEAAPAEPPPTE